MAEWKPALGWAWEYEVGPFCGVLVSFYLDDSGCQSRYAGQILTPNGPHCAAQLFVTMAAAQGWIEHEIERLRLNER